MVYLPAECTSCGHRFQTNFWADAISDASFIGNLVSCANCEGLARVIDGKMNIEHGGIEIIAAPQWSIDLVKHLRLGLVRILEEQPEDLIEAVAEIDPKVGGWLKRATTGWTRDQILYLLGRIIVPLILGIAPGWNALNEAHAAIENVLRDATPPTGDAPASPLAPPPAT